LGDDETQAVVLTGAGSEFFSMGILSPVVQASYSKEQVVIAALNGAARAGAAELSLACEIRLAATHATFALPEARGGGFPGAGGPARLPALVGRARALEIICTSRELGAAELERLGLALGVYPADRLLLEARALSDTLRDAFERSQDVDEGAAAHREGRTPRFTGR
jgi:enoyl-CoA hydratase